MRDLAAQSAFIAERRSLPFAWGSNDCCTFAGVDPLGGKIPWKDKRSATRFIARHGGLLNAVSTFLTEIPVAHAHRGDVGAVDSPQGPLLMVIEGVTLVGPDIKGTSRLPRAKLIMAWSAQR